MVDLDWQRKAACRDLTWFTLPGFTDEAREVCLACPVSEPCTDYAFTDHALGIPGVLAGLTLTQRGQVECVECGNTVWQRHSRRALCWKCYEKARAAS